MQGMLDTLILPDINCLVYVIEKEGVGIMKAVQLTALRVRAGGICW